MVPPTPPPPSPGGGGPRSHCSPALLFLLEKDRRNISSLLFISVVLSLVLLGNQTKVVVVWEGGDEIKGQTLPRGKSAAQAPLVRTLMTLIGVIAVVS